MAALPPRLRARVALARWSYARGALAGRTVPAQFAARIEGVRRRSLLVSNRHVDEYLMSVLLNEAQLLNRADDSSRLRSLGRRGRAPLRSSRAAVTPR